MRRRGGCGGGGRRTVDTRGGRIEHQLTATCGRGRRHGRGRGGAEEAIRVLARRAELAGAVDRAGA